MIKYIYANNYKSFVNFRVEFSQLSLVLGKNGSGKSNLLRLIFHIRNLIMGSNRVLEEAFPITSLTRWVKSNIQTFELGIEENGKEYIYVLEVEHDRDINKSQILMEQVTCDGKLVFLTKDGKTVLYEGDSEISLLADTSFSGISLIPGDSKYSSISTFKKAIAAIILCIPDPKRMVSLVQNDVFLPLVDFSNIGSAYAGLMQLDMDICNEIMDKYRGVDASFQKVRMNLTSFGKALTFDYKYNDFVGSYDFTELSDGEKVIFSLYVLLVGYAKRGMTVLLDEPDNFISIRELQPWCQELEAELSDDGQCILISHNSEIIDYMAESNGICLSRLKSGESTIVSLEKVVGDNKDLLNYSELMARGVFDEA